MLTALPGQAGGARRHKAESASPPTPGVAYESFDYILRSGKVTRGMG